MIQTRSRRTAWPVLLLAAAMLLSAGATAVTVGADAQSAPDTEASPAAQAVPDSTPEPTPFPTFDPSTAPIRIDLLMNGLEDRSLSWSPVYVTDDGTGKGCIYVVERTGKVWAVNPDDGFNKPQPFLDISKLVRVGAEQGLHTIAFHPDFKRNGRLFAHYTSDDKTKWGSSVVAEFRGKPCGKASSKPLKRLTVEQPLPNNNGGWMGFGPDGYLYVALGDGGGDPPGDPKGYGQSTSSPLSKILRLDVSDARRTVAPKSNPYFKKKRGFHPMTWAWGLRNPRRASFDRETGDLWIGDVGQDRYEEVDRIPAGATRPAQGALNFGWSDMEGDRCHNLVDCDPGAYELPVHFYDKTPPNVGGITGGYVYRGEAMPGLQGVYLFSDASSGFIWGIDTDAVRAGETALAHVLLDAPQGIVSFGEDDDGELYVVAADGSVYRIEPESA
jgi:glucose/arabinose dehydrogenase